MFVRGGGTFGAGRCAVAAAAAAARGIVNDKIMRPGYNFLLPGVRSEPSEPMIRKVYNELLRSMDKLNIRSIDDKHIFCKTCTFRPYMCVIVFSWDYSFECLWSDNQQYRVIV